MVNHPSRTPFALERHVASSIENVLLEQFPETVRMRLVARAQVLELHAGERLMEPEAALDHAYFPRTATLSMLRVFENGASVEVGMIGRDGLLGVHALLRMYEQPNASLVQADGEVVRVPISALVEAFDAHLEVRDICLRYIHFMLIQAAQIAACNRAHSAEERLARWLLSMHDRVVRDELTVTQDFLSHMLATRRATINGAMAALCEAGPITRRRNHVTVVDRPGLEALACECYEALAHEAYRAVRFQPHARSEIRFSAAAR